jgi:hypothetical protein
MVQVVTRERFRRWRTIMLHHLTIRTLATAFSLWLAASSLGACAKKKDSPAKPADKPGMEAVVAADAPVPTMEATPAVMADDMAGDPMGDAPSADDPTVPKAGQATARLILVPWKDAEGAGEEVKITKAAAKEQAEKILAEAKKTPTEAEFKKLAKKHSYGPTKENGGLVGPMLPEDVEGHFKTIFTLKKDEISGVVEAPSGYHIFMRTK